ncbi:hypothetical protein SAPIO_CDS6950 [Scedosporium apiospermum]|uniref:Uncharacterized protein n=1 Tax=Pseudallescheria apiosperma TaxID=563466 RepID=A0A084G2S6_PSEDA|nr:uncharacterized protein SAPIO_CDS6950 [Scedosporium apiospermum]KEZ41638.1 hypothetical protein SAPIO_CDS6950 [Scedosporium apiospermum]
MLQKNALPPFISPLQASWAETGVGPQQQHAEFDKWELLAAFQALLVYCLLRLQEVPVGNDGLEAALLTTVNLVFNALVLSAGGIRKMNLPDDPGVTWMDWIYNESRRR